MKLSSLAADRTDRMTIGMAMLLIAGAALGFWLALETVKSQTRSPNGPDEELITDWALRFWCSCWGDSSLVGPALLLVAGQKRPWGTGPVPLVRRRDGGMAALAASDLPSGHGARGPTPDERALFLLWHASDGTLRHAHSPCRRSSEAISSAQVVPLMAGDVRVAFGPHVGMHRPLYHFALLSSGLYREVIRPKRNEIHENRHEPAPLDDPRHS